MTLSELIAAYGDDRVVFQKLDDCADRLDWSAKSGTKISFGTDVPVTPNGTEKMGLIVWMDRDRVAQIMKGRRDEN